MTGQVESLHCTHHRKHAAGAHVIDYTRGFASTVQAGLQKQLNKLLITLTTKRLSILGKRMR